MITGSPPPRLVGIAIEPEPSYDQPGLGRIVVSQVSGHRGPGAGTFHGRAGRGEFWMLMIMNAFAAALAGSVPTFGPLLATPWIVGAFAVTTRRLHDMRRSGWWQVAPVLMGLPLFAAIAVLESQGLIEGELAPPQHWVDVTNSFGMLWAISCAAFVFWVAFFPGTRGPNCYGEADTLLA